MRAFVFGLLATACADAIEPPTSDDTTADESSAPLAAQDNSLPPPEGDGPGTPPGSATELDPPVVVIAGDEPSTPPQPTVPQPELFDIAAPGDDDEDENQVDDEYEEDQGGAYDFEGAQETPGETTSSVPPGPQGEPRVEPQPPTSFAPSYDPVRLPPATQPPKLTQPEPPPKSTEKLLQDAAAIPSGTMRSGNKFRSSSMVA